MQDESDQIKIFGKLVYAITCISLYVSCINENILLLWHKGLIKLLFSQTKLIWISLPKITKEWAIPEVTETRTWLLLAPRSSFLAIISPDNDVYITFPLFLVFILGVQNTVWKKQYQKRKYVLDITLFHNM